MAILAPKKATLELSKRSAAAKLLLMQTRFDQPALLHHPSIIVYFPLVALDARRWGRWQMADCTIYSLPGRCQKDPPGLPYKPIARR